MTYKEFKSAIIKASKRSSCKLYMCSMAVKEWFPLTVNENKIHTWSWNEFENLLEADKWENYHDYSDNTTIMNIDGNEYKIKLFVQASLEDI